MPKAVATSETFRYDLKSLPEGFVVLRRFNYGEMIRRRELSVSAKGTQQQNSDNAEVSMDINLGKVSQYEFSTAIIEHNLQDENDNLLNFKSVADVIKLDPRVAQEVEDLIDELNKPPSKEATDPLVRTSGMSSPVTAVPEMSGTP